MRNQASDIEKGATIKPILKTARQMSEQSYGSESDVKDGMSSISELVPVES